MRLIDADVLLKNLEWLEDYDHYVLHDVKISMDETPTVKAIPIEWLYQKRTLYLENKCYMSLMVINEILNWWEKENGRD